MDNIRWQYFAGQLVAFVRWSDQVEWRFHEFLYLVAWSTVHSLMAPSLYPSKLLIDYFGRAAAKVCACVRTRNVRDGHR